MAMYRVLHRLDVGKGRVLCPGSFTRLEWLEETGTTRLEMRGAVSRVRPPPLAVLPGWKRRAAKASQELDVTDAEQFLELDDEKIAEEMRVKPETAARWKKEIVGWLTADPAGGG